MHEFCGNFHSWRRLRLSRLFTACLVLKPSLSFSSLFLFPQLLEAQADYHRKSLMLLECVLPTIQAQQGEVYANIRPHTPKQH